MESPYYNTYLYTEVILNPNQMNNDIYKHLKDNLINKLNGKCYKGYGHISKIYAIEERKGGQIIPENPSAAAIYNVKFSCKLCKPLKNHTLICEVVDINKSVIHLINGPIHVFIMDGYAHVNQNNFVYDEKRNVYLAKLENGKGIPVDAGTFVKVKVIASTIQDKNTKIIVIGTLESLATEKEKNESITSKEKDDSKFVTYDDIVGETNQVDVVAEAKEESMEESDETDSDDEA